jgi:arginase
VFPQWQGYALSDAPQRGAHAIAEQLQASEQLHEIAVEGWHALRREQPRGTPGEVLGLREIHRQSLAVRGWLEANEPARLLVIGGDCGSDIGPMTWQAERFAGRLGVLYLDAHGDLNTPASSPSARFHGMVLRSMFGAGNGPPTLTDLAVPLAASRLVMAGTRDLDPPERSFIEAAGIQPWSSAAIADGSVVAAVAAHPASHWHVHLDLDVLDPDDFPDVTVPTPGGPSLEAVTRLLVDLVRRREVVGITITEHVGREPSAHRVAELIAALRRAGWR